MYTSISALVKEYYISLSILTVLITVLVAAVWYHQYNLAQENTDAAKTLQTSEDTPYTTLAGEPYSFTEYEKSIRVVTTWATWSPYSAEQLTLFDELAEMYADKGVVFLAINRKEPRYRIESYLAAQSKTFTNLDLVIDETDAFYKAAAGYAMPETRVYDRSGDTIVSIQGPVTKTQIETALNQLITN